MKFVALFLVLFMSIAINLPEGYLSVLGLDGNVLTAALAAVVLAGLVAHRRMFFVVLVVVISVAANLPETTIERIGVDRDILIASLIAVVLVPFVLSMIGDSE